MKHRGYWSDLSVEAFRGLAPSTIAVLPLGAIEQHGPHLPVSVDRDIIDAVVERSIPLLEEPLSVLFLPTQAVCKSNEHISFPGTLTLSAETVMRVWMEIGAGVARAGLKKLVLFNSHGGNVSAMDIVARDLRQQYGLLVAHCSSYQFSASETVVSARDYRHGIHGGEGETSAMLAIRPNLVDMSRAEDFRSAGEDWAQETPSIGVAGPVKVGWLMQDLNEKGAAGNAALGTREKGEQILEASARGFVAFLHQFDRMSADHLEAEPS